MPKLKRLSLEIDYFYKEQLDDLLQGIRMRYMMEGDVTLKKGGAILKGRLTHPTPLIEPRIVIEDGKEVHYYKSNM